MRILGDRVLIRRDEAETTEGGIYLPQSAQEKPQRGTVVAVGEGKRLKDGTLVPPEVAPGDRVVFAKYGGTEVKVDGEELIIMNMDSVYAKLCA